MLLRLIVAAFLVGHAAIHTGFVAPRPPAAAGGPPWPFTLDRSWILTPVGLDEGLARGIGVALVVITIVGFAVAASAVVGLLPAAAWPVSTAIGSAASIALLGLFFHPWLGLGLAIDVALLWVAIFGHLTPETLTS